MSKENLISAIAEKAEITKAAAERAANAFIEYVTSALGNGEKVALPGFGSWEVSNRAARTGRDPQSGKTIQIAAKRVPKFKPGKKLKDIVNNEKKHKEK